MFPAVWLIDLAKSFYMFVSLKYSKDGEVPNASHQDIADPLYQDAWNLMFYSICIVDHVIQQPAQHFPKYSSAITIYGNVEGHSLSYLKRSTPTI